MAASNNYTNFLQSINWENYKNEDGSYWQISEVLYSKLNYLLEDVADLDDEHIDTIQTAQRIVSLLTEEQLELLFNQKL